MNKSPSRRVRELDNRGSHYYLATYWAEALAQQSDDAELAAEFAPVAEKLVANEQAIIAELNEAQGIAGDLGGYYLPVFEKASALMRPSKTLNDIIGA